MSKGRKELKAEVKALRARLAAFDALEIQRDALARQVATMARCNVKIVRLNEAIRAAFVPDAEIMRIVEQRAKEATEALTDAGYDFDDNRKT